MSSDGTEPPNPRYIAYGVEPLMRPYRAPVGVGANLLASASHSVLV